MKVAQNKVRPSGSYQIILPEGISKQVDERVSSYWLANHPELLQISSYIRTTERQVEAVERLHDRIAKSPASWCIWEQPLNKDISAQQAIGEMTDDHGLLWIHVYLVWPHLTVYATLSGPEATIKNEKNWAYNALATLSLNRQ